MVYEPIEAIPYHYEQVVEKDPVHELKQQVFQAMRQLQGWCSEKKASVLVDLILLTKPQTIVEIGVWGGKSLVPMAIAARALGSAKVYGIDPWSPADSVVGFDDENYEWWSKVDHEGVYKTLCRKIEQFGLSHQITLIRKTSSDADLIPEIGLIHIDGNHSEASALFDVMKWVPQVKRGGIIVFDDMDWKCTGPAVSWLNEHCVPVAQVKGDNVWGIWIKP